MAKKGGKKKGWTNPKKESAPIIEMNCGGKKRGCSFSEDGLPKMKAA